MKHKLGLHTVDIQGDIAYITMVGDCSALETAQLLILMEEIAARHGVFYVVTDVRQMGSINAEARRRVGQWMGIQRCGGTAVFGASLVVRTLLTLVSRANTVLTKSERPGNLRFFSSMEDACAWIDARRIR